MNNIPIVSVLMPVYNTKEEWLREAIESILNQTFKDFEFIIINDGSTNNAEDVILSYQDSRIVYIKQENQGIAKALNNGLKIAQGKYIARMDSDDISTNTRLEKQATFLDKNQNISIVGSWYNMFLQNKVMTYLQHPKYLDFIKECCIGHPTVMFRKDNFIKYNLSYNPEYKCEDYELWSRAVRYLNFANLQEVLLNYRWHENNLSKPSEDFTKSFIKVRQNMLDFMTDDKELQKKIFSMLTEEENKNSFIENIFSIKNSYSRTLKVITILGIRISFKRNKYKE